MLMKTISPLLLIVVAAAAVAQTPSKPHVPTFRADPAWPAVPNNWILGEVSSIAVDSKDHVWILHRPRTVPADQQANAAPAVLEFETSGWFIQAWGGPKAGYDWPEREHGIYVDPEDNVWIGGNNGYG